MWLLLVLLGISQVWLWMELVWLRLRLGLVETTTRGGFHP